VSRPDRPEPGRLRVALELPVLEGSDRFEVRDVRFSPELVEKMSHADWPGNVRQVESCVARIVALSSDEAVIGPEEFDASAASLPAPVAAAPATPDAESVSLYDHLESVERELVTRMLTATSGNQSEAARRLGISRTALIDRMKKYGLTS
jgi:DNA-binding NtrC family response regulator